MTTRPERPRLRLACCLCGRVIRGDVYPLDAEWRRRHPQMRGRLACRCALGDRFAFVCGGPGGFVAGHMASEMLGPGGRDIDHWSHVGPPHTQFLAAVSFPAEAIAQGAAEYVRWVATARRGTAPEVRSRLLECLAAI